jgi:hypothetical protein
VPIDENTAALRPPSLVAGVGASKGVAADEVLALARRGAGRGLSRDSVTALATVDAKAMEEGSWRPRGRVAIAAQVPVSFLGPSRCQPGWSSAAAVGTERGRGGGPGLATNSW